MKFYTNTFNIADIRRLIIILIKEIIFMHKIDVDELFEGKQSKYALVVGVSKRARQITSTFEEEGTVTEDKPVLLAIDEIKNHEINLYEPDEDEL